MSDLMTWLFFADYTVHPTGIMLLIAVGWVGRSKCLHLSRDKHQS